jgi:hypothetical protein
MIAKTLKTIDIVRNRLIDKIMVTNNEQLLSAIENIFNSTQTDDKLTLDSQQIEMLKMSENDIQDGNLISESNLEEEDSKWMD